MSKTTAFSTFTSASRIKNKKKSENSEEIKREDYSVLDRELTTGY